MIFYISRYQFITTTIRYPVIIYILYISIYLIYIIYQNDNHDNKNLNFNWYPWNQRIFDYMFNNECLFKLYINHVNVYQIDKIMIF